MLWLKSFNFGTTKKVDRVKSDSLGEPMIVPIPLVGGAPLKWAFFQSVLADRYIYRREMRVVSLKSSSNVEFGIKKTFFLNFLFFKELSRVKILSENGIFGIILFTFSLIFVQIKTFLDI